ncbi:MAG: hypothetical protein AAB402_00935 [Patescibacteria group bacterium]|mgnify:CR=1 FL=1
MSPVAVYTIVVYAKKPNGFEAFLYRPGEPVPTDALLMISHESANGRPDKKQLRLRLKQALASQGIDIREVSNLSGVC